MLYVSIIGNTLECGENERFRFLISPFVLILFLSAIKDLWGRYSIERINLNARSGD